MTDKDRREAIEYYKFEAEMESRNIELSPKYPEMQRNISEYKKRLAYAETALSALRNEYASASQMTPQDKELREAVEFYKNLDKDKRNIFDLPKEEQDVIVVKTQIYHKVLLSHAQALLGRVPKQEKDKFKIDKLYERFADVIKEKDKYREALEKMLEYYKTGKGEMPVDIICKALQLL